MSRNDPIRIETVKTVNANGKHIAAGQEFEVPSFAAAKRLYPGAKVLRYQDGRAWDGPSHASKESEEKFRATKRDAKAEKDAEAETAPVEPAVPETEPTKP